MENSISSKYKNSYKEEYDALIEAVFGEASAEAEEARGFVPPEILYDNDGKSFFDVQPADLVFTQQYDEEDYEESLWAQVPDLLLENIFSYLTMRQRYYASMVCKSWHRGFYFPNVWRTFVFDDKTLTRRLFNYYSGWQYMLDHLRTQLCLKAIGRHVKTLIFKPINNFYNLYEFMNMISFYSEQQFNPNCSVKGVGSLITSLQYTFPCNMATRNETRLYGTGGKLLDALKRLMTNLPSLRDLRLIDLMLDSYEALQLLDDICFSHCYSMTKLVLINISKTQCPLLHVGVFLNLQELVISPQSLDDDVIHLLSDTKLRDLCIVQNSYTPVNIKSVTSRAWKTARKQNPWLRVHLYVDSAKDQQLLWQECAPVFTILFNSSLIKFRPEVIAQTVDYYNETLTVFGYTKLPRYHQPKSFHERIDSHCMYLNNSCRNLNTLFIRERISTATILLLASSMKNVEHLYIRRNAVILRNDWPKNPEWSDQFYNWLKSASQSYDDTEKEVSVILGYKWKMMSDKEFMFLSLTLY